MPTQEELLNRIRDLEREVKQLNSQIKRQKYGLTWLDVPEAFDTESENKIPILEEVPELAIHHDDGKPTHILIEGDNYHALTCLNYTHKGKIDVIYIDPPYNTGKDGFTYRDERFLNEYPDGVALAKKHPLRHSSWYSFLSKRLRLAFTLLKESGIILISLDDHEQAAATLLCNQIFGEENKIAVLPTIMNLKGNQDEFGFAGTHEYTLVYAKNKQTAKIGMLALDEEETDKWEKDDIGYYKKGATLKSTGVNAPREKRPNLFYPILISLPDKRVSTITQAEYLRIYNKQNKVFDDAYLKILKWNYESNGYAFLLPITNGKEMSWRWQWATVREKSEDIIVVGDKFEFSLYKKQRPEFGDLPSKKPKSILYKPEYSSGNGTLQLVNIFGSKVFDNPKPIELLKDLLFITTDEKSIVLDFFAGSGTTCHALMEINKQFGGQRQCIMVQKPEPTYVLVNGVKHAAPFAKNAFEAGFHKITDITYERNKRVMNGYTDSKGNDVVGLGHSLKYYRTAFVGKHQPQDAMDEDRIALSQKAGCLLALAENTLDETECNDFYQFYSDRRGRHTAIYFQEDLSRYGGFLQKVEKLKGHVVVYVFSFGTAEEFRVDYDMMGNVELKAIPQPILDIYKSLKQ